MQPHRKAHYTELGLLLPFKYHFILQFEYQKRKKKSKEKEMPSRITKLSTASAN